MGNPPLKVFIADDSAVMRERLVTLIGEIENATIVGQAENAEQTVEYVRRTNPAVLILDIRMPGSGMTALEAIKKFSKPPFVIVLTAFPYPQVRQRCLDMGADLFLDKTSAEIDQIAEVIKRKCKSVIKDEEKEMNTKFTCTESLSTSC